MRHAFWWTPEFVSVELLMVKKYPKTREILKIFEVKTKPKVLENLKGYGKSWNLKSSKECEPCINSSKFRLWKKTSP